MGTSTDRILMTSHGVCGKKRGKGSGRPAVLHGSEGWCLKLR